MLLLKQAAPILRLLHAQKKDRKQIGFVPTMGALHPGHLSLINLSRKENDITICSIFVNPTQFNNPEDFRLYPITLEKDVQLLLESGCDVLFLPSVEDVYPSGYQKKHYELGMMESLLEGRFRPGHFQGVCQVVDRLLDMVQPNTLYLGQKDYQQCMVVQKLLDLTGRQDLKLKVCPTLREADGLAMSSRNMRLSPGDREKARQISEVLRSIKNNLPFLPVDDLKREATQKLEAEGFEVDYVEIANAHTLEPEEKKSEPLVALIAASLNGVRLIDNMVISQ